MNTIRNISFLAFLLTVLWISPARAAACPTGCTCDEYQCGPNMWCAEAYCDFSPYTCQEALPLFCSEAGMACLDYCGPEYANMYCDDESFACWMNCWCG